MQSIEDLRAGKVAWLEKMRGEVARGNASVDAAQVERLGVGADKLLREYETTTSANRRLLCSAALEYLASVEDAISDLVVGGLDDDEHVFRVVDAELRRQE